jgi:sporulation protein YlmC with PRC-barrel domain
MMQKVEAAPPAHPTISAHRVEGSAVYNLDGDWIGKIEDLLIEKVSGQVTSAIMSYGGGPLGASVGRFPIPWSCLSYDPGRRGYKVDEERLKVAAPLGADDHSSDLPWREGVYSHWAAPPYWFGAKPRPNG